MSFILSLYYYAIRTANNIVEFRLRLLDGEVYDVENMEMGSTVLNNDDGFFFCYFPSSDSVEAYNRDGKELIEKHVVHQN